MPTYDKSDIQRRMHGAVEALKHDLGGDAKLSFDADGLSCEIVIPV